MIDVDILVKREHFLLNVKESFSAGITGIYGPSGSGKTTLLQTIAGLVKPDKGDISFFGYMVLSKERKIDLAPDERRIGYVFQEGRLFPHLTVEKNLLYAYKDDSDGLTFRDVIDLLKIKHLLKQRPSQLSGGERQRVALGRTLLSSPRLLLLDEPFSALDTHLRSQIIPFLHRIHKVTKIPILVVSHDLTDLLKLTNKLFIIKNGRSIGHGDYTLLLKNPAIREMLGTREFVNSIDMKVTSRDIESGVVMMRNDKNQDQVRAVVSKNRNDCMPGSMVKFFLPSDDIVLARTKVEDISVMNQLKGEVKQVINGNNINICVIDVGFDIVVELSSDSVRRLGIKPGVEMWCLFKSVSVELVS